MTNKARQLLGERVRQCREAAGLSIAQLAEKMSTPGKPAHRTFIYDIEAGRENFTVDYWEKLLRACGVSPGHALAGVTSSDIPPEYQDLFRMLQIITTKAPSELIDALRIVFDAITDKALRLSRRPPPARKQHGTEPTTSKHHA